MSEEYVRLLALLAVLVVVDIPEGQERPAEPSKVHTEDELAVFSGGVSSSPKCGPLIIATGGFATVIQPQYPAIERLEPDLTLQPLPMAPEMLTAELRSGTQEHDR